MSAYGSIVAMTPDEFVYRENEKKYLKQRKIEERREAEFHDARMRAMRSAADSFDASVKLFEAQTRVYNMIFAILAKGASEEELDLIDATLDAMATSPEVI